jgi:uncharacterized membrane protein YcaP (DUF421 family)
MFFDDSWALVRTLVVGVAAYAFLVLLLRVSGKRTLSKWNAFDFVVTIAIGSTLATALLSKTTTLAQGVVALTLLVLLHFGITWLSVRSKALRRWIKAEPTLLLREGRILHDALRSERVTEGELHAALRARGFGRVEDVGAVVLETDGSFSVIGTLGDEPASALVGVVGHPATSTPS